jgi:hypothetical protein
VQSIDAVAAAVSPALLDIGLSSLPTVDAAPVPVDVDPKADRNVHSDNIEAAQVAPPEQEPARYVTAAFPGLIELTLGIHEEPSHTSSRLRDVRLGDRVGITAESLVVDGRHWVQALIEIAEGPDRLGWLDASFTDLGLQAEPAADAVDNAPPGLSIKGWLRPNDPAASLPCFMGVYDEQTRTPITTISAGSDWRSLLAVYPMTGGTDPDYREMVVQGRPRYALRERLRVATQEELSVQEDSLTAKQMGEVRRFAVTQPAAIQAAFF